MNSKMKALGGLGLAAAGTVLLTGCPGDPAPGTPPPGNPNPISVDGPWYSTGSGVDTCSYRVSFGTAQNFSFGPGLAARMDTSMFGCGGGTWLEGCYNDGTKNGPYCSFVYNSGSLQWGLPSNHIGDAFVCYSAKATGSSSWAPVKRLGSTSGTCGNP